MMKDYKVLFISFDPKINDLEWKLPLIKGYVDRGCQVQVLLLYFLSTDTKPFIFNILKETGAEIIFRDELDNIEPLPEFFIKILRRFSVLSKSFHALTQIYFSETHWLCAKLGLHAARKKAFQKFFEDWFNRTRIIFLNHMPQKPQSFLQLLVYESSFLSKGFSVGLPMGSYTHWYYESMMPFNLILVTSDIEKKECAQSVSCPVESVGSLHFREIWVRYLSEQYELWLNKKGARIELPQNKKVILVILTSKKHIHWNGIDHDETTLKLISQLVSEDNIVLIKPHPRHSLNELKKLLAHIPEARYRFVDGYIGYWAALADDIVSLISFGALSSLPFKKVTHVYWPMTPSYQRHLDEQKAPAVTRVYLRKYQDGHYGTYLDDLTIPIMQETLKLHHLTYDEKIDYFTRFQKMFRTNESVDQTIELIENKSRLTTKVISTSVGAPICES